MSNSDTKFHDKVDIHDDDAYLVTSNEVYFSDHDEVGHVNNRVFFRWFEQARYMYLYHCFIVHDPRDTTEPPLPKEMPLLVVSAIDRCRFVRQLRYPEVQVVDLAIKAERLDETTIELSVRIENGHNGELAFIGVARVTAVDAATGKRASFPADVRRRIEWYRAYPRKRNLMHRMQGKAKL
jgi:acyl-CoA thioester hydrolase